MLTRLPCASPAFPNAPYLRTRPFSSHVSTPAIIAGPAKIRPGSLANAPTIVVTPAIRMIVMATVAFDLLLISMVASVSQ
jgi:hypothetical protein